MDEGGGRKPAQPIGDGAEGGREDSHLGQAGQHKRPCRGSMAAHIPCAELPPRRQRRHHDVGQQEAEGHRRANAVGAVGGGIQQLRDQEQRHQHVEGEMAALGPVRRPTMGETSHQEQGDRKGGIALVEEA